jgi:hypothetical protein
MIVPINTKRVPIQWYKVNGLLKYNILNNKLANFRNVITSVTVNDEHSVVKK